MNIYALHMSGVSIFTYTETLAQAYALSFSQLLRIMADSTICSNDYTSDLLSEIEYFLRIIETNHIDYIRPLDLKYILDADDLKQVQQNLAMCGHTDRVLGYRMDGKFYNS